MSKPRGYYFDPALGRARRLTPFQDWLACTAIVTVLAGTFGWMVSMLTLGWWLWPDFDGNDGFFAVYLASVAVWVVPGSIYFAFAVRKHARYMRSLEAMSVATEYITRAARLGELKRYDQPPIASWSAFDVYLSKSEAEEAEQLLTVGVLVRSEYDQLTNFPYWVISLAPNWRDSVEQA